MGLFKNTMAKIGIGGAKVDTILHNPNVNCGEVLEGKCVITGGKVPQYIKYIAIDIRTDFEEEKDDTKFRQTVNLFDYKIEINRPIEAGSTHEIPFSFILPVNLPIPRIGYEVSAHTVLVISKGMESSQDRKINLGMHPMLHQLHDIIELKLGLKFKEINNVYKYSDEYYQILRYKPIKNSPLSKQIDEIGFIFTVYQDRIEIVIKMDSKKGFLTEMLGLDKNYTTVVYKVDDFANPDEIANNLYSTILKYKR